MAKHSIKARQSSILVSNYELGFSHKLESSLSIWDSIYFKLDTPGYVYDEATKTLRLPRGLDLLELEAIFKTKVDIDRDFDPFDRASIRLMVEPRGDTQRKAIAFLLGEGDFDYSKKYSQLALDVDTGDGKTYCVIAYLTFNKTKSLIITTKDNIKDQWRNSIKKFTDVDDKAIFDIKGSASIRKLLKMDMNKAPYKIFLVNHRTIQSYAKSEGWDKVGELFKKLKIGVKVFDEAHEEFTNMVNVDLHTNTKKTIYLTANLERSSKDENAIYNMIFKNIPKYGRETRNDKRKHIVYVMVKYDSKPGLDEQLYIKGTHGFDKNRYIDYQVQQDIFYRALNQVTSFVGEKEGKMMVMASKIDAINVISDYLSENFEARTPFAYNSTISDDDKLKALNSDLIVSTPKSLGTGSDIPGLRFLANTEQYSSAITANQISGRLREYGPDKYTFYFEVIDTGFPIVNDMLRKRLKVFKKKCVDIIEIKVK